MGLQDLSKDRSLFPVLGTGDKLVSNKDQSSVQLLLRTLVAQKLNISFKHKNAV